MFLGKITGHVVASQKDKALNGQKLFVVEPLNVQYDGDETRVAWQYAAGDRRARRRRGGRRPTGPGLPGLERE